MPRIKLADENNIDGNYFTSAKTEIEFIDSGWVGLNCVLGGGWPLGRISNIIGDKSTGKTLTAVEACANFSRQYSKGRIFYRESESAFDEDYAAALGMPLDRVEFVDPDEFVTVEDFYNDLIKCTDLTNKESVPSLYIVDSLDALSDTAEQERGFDEGTFGTSKAKQMGKLFRIITRKINASRMHLMIISQERDKIGVTFGKKSTRSGGRALDFYASQILWLSHVKTLKQTKNKIERPVGIQIKAKCEKNKISLPYRECEFTLKFGFGIDCIDSSLELLKDINCENLMLNGEKSLAYKQRLTTLSDADYWEEVRRIDRIVIDEWKNVEDSFLEDVRKKY